MTAVAVPLIVIGTVTAVVTTLLKLALTVTVCVPLLPSVVEAVVVSKEMVGKATSSLVIVWVWVVLDPKVAPVGVPMVSMTVSLDSIVVSPTTLKLALPVVLPAAMVIEVGALV